MRILTLLALLVFSETLIAVELELSKEYHVVTMNGKAIVKPNTPMPRNTSVTTW